MKRTICFEGTRLELGGQRGRLAQPRFLEDIIKNFKANNVFILLTAERAGQ